MDDMKLESEIDRMAKYDFKQRAAGNIYSERAQSSALKIEPIEPGPYIDPKWDGRERRFSNEGVDHRRGSWVQSVRASDIKLEKNWVERGQGKIDPRRPPAGQSLPPDTQTVALLSEVVTLLRDIRAILQGVSPMADEYPIGKI